MIARHVSNGTILDFHLSTGIDLSTEVSRNSRKPSIEKSFNFLPKMCSKPEGSMAADNAGQFVAEKRHYWKLKMVRIAQNEDPFRRLVCGTIRTMSISRPLRRLDKRVVMKRRAQGSLKAEPSSGSCSVVVMAGSFAWMAPTVHAIFADCVSRSRHRRLNYRAFARFCLMFRRV